MREVVVVSYARTGLAKSVRGGFNITHGAALAGHVIQHAIAKAGVDPAQVEDVVIGCGQPEGATGHNVARNAAIWAGCPVTTAGQTVSRYCSSGLQAVASAAHYIAEGADTMVAGGVESLSLVQMSGHLNLFHYTEEKLMQVARTCGCRWWRPPTSSPQRYGVSREVQDEYALRSQQRIAAAQAAGLFKDEIVPMSTQMKKVDKATGAETVVDYVVERDECNRPETTLEVPGQSAAGSRARQHRQRGQFLPARRRRRGPGADGGQGGVKRRGLQPLGAFKGFAIAGCAPDEMGVGPVIAVPRLLERHG